MFRQVNCNQNNQRKQTNSKPLPTHLRFNGISVLSKKIRYLDIEREYQDQRYPFQSKFHRFGFGVGFGFGLSGLTVLGFAFIYFFLVQQIHNTPFD